MGGSPSALKQTFRTSGNPCFRDQAGIRSARTAGGAGGVGPKCSRFYGEVSGMERGADQKHGREGQSGDPVNTGTFRQFVSTWLPEDRPSDCKAQTLDTSGYAGMSDARRRSTGDRRGGPEFRRCATAGVRYHRTRITARRHGPTDGTTRSRTRYTGSTCWHLMIELQDIGTRYRGDAADLQTGGRCVKGGGLRFYAKTRRSGIPCWRWAGIKGT